MIVMSCPIDRIWLAYDRVNWLDDELVYADALLLHIHRSVALEHMQPYVYSRLLPGSVHRDGERFEP